YNSDLANTLGNLLSRVTTVVAKKCGGVGPAPQPDSPLAEVAATSYRGAADGWARIQPSVALDAVWDLLRETNAYLERNEPWKMEEGSDGVEAVMGDTLEVLRLAAILASPALTRGSRTIWEAIGLAGSPLDQRLPEAAAWGGYPGGLEVVKGQPLFPRLKVDADG
ncbi:MAG: methionine--tRNA ligase, partial [Acidimicrobiia bacterium]|nr:methionine--tRNA ligase [Acidimicrobiia bacterium]